MENFSTTRSIYLAYEGSDHKPLISALEPGKKHRPGIFRYDRRLKDNEEVTKLIREAWTNAPNLVVTDRIKLIRGVISRWNKEQQLNSRSLIEQKRRDLEAAQSSSLNDTQLIHQITEDLKKAYKAEEAYWRQRSRLLWLRLGDRNFGFFHVVTKNRKRINAFTVIEDSDGNSVYREGEIGQVIVKYFGTLFTSLTRERSEIEAIVNKALSPVISANENEKLILIPSPTEIRDAVFSLHADKAPGPDGFSAGFFHTHWETIGADIVREVQEFFETSKLPPSINETFIRLIPNIQNPKTVANYRPIALCNVYYKIVSKILTKRLQPLLPNIISENQSAFVQGRAISDNVLITHEVLYFLQNSKAEKICSMAVKTDMSKAYDRLEWEFIRLVLERLGFHSRWIAWILECVSSVTYAFLIDGSSRGKVNPMRGIRQGALSHPTSSFYAVKCF